MQDSSNRRFIQFPHPGTEHWPDDGRLKRWHPRKQSHRRKFLSLTGQWWDGTRGDSGTLWAWGEWEPESEVITELQRPGFAYPKYLWQPFYTAKSSYKELHNTDPFIYEGFYYTNCKQASTASLEGLRHLNQGSVIVFGSSLGGAWVVDTVLVVADFIDHHVSDYHRTLKGLIPDPYWDITLAPSYVGAPEPGHEKYADWWFRLYRGAAIEAPLDGMFSFFPCIPAGANTGFPRPSIILPPDYFTLGLRQGAKGHSMGASGISGGELVQLWKSIHDQVLAQGLMLGTYAAMPELRPAVVQ